MNSSKKIRENRQQNLTCAPKILIAQLSDLLFLQKTVQFLTQQYAEASLAILPQPAQQAEIETWLEQFVERDNNVGKRISLVNHLDQLKQEEIGIIVFMYHPFNRHRLEFLKHCFVLNSHRAKKYLISHDGYWSRFSLAKQINIFLFLGISKLLISPLLYILAWSGIKIIRFLRKMLTFDEYKEIKNWSAEGWSDTRDEIPKMLIDAAGIILKAREQGQTDLLQERACNLCGQNKPEFLFTSEDGFDYVRCQNCGYTYVNPIMSLAAWKYLERQYPNWQETAEQTYLTYARSEKGLLENHNRFSHYLNLLNKYTFSKGKILDIGCAGGSFLALAKMQGWQTVGVEKSRLYTSAAIKDYNLSIINANIEEVYQDLLKEYNGFEAMTMWETLEHVDDPNRILQITNELLVNHGLIGISAPNMESLYVKLLKERFAPCTGLGHINMFTAKTLSQMLEKNGFEVLHTHTLEPGWVELLALLNLDFRQARSISGYASPANRTHLLLHEAFVEQASRLLAMTYSKFLTKLTEPIHPGPILVCLARKRKEVFKVG